MLEQLIADCARLDEMAHADAQDVYLHERVLHKPNHGSFQLSTARIVVIKEYTVRKAGLELKFGFD